MGFSNPRRALRTSIAVLCVCDTSIFALRLFIVRNHPVPDALDIDRGVVVKEGWFSNLDVWRARCPFIPLCLCNSLSVCSYLNLHSCVLSNYSFRLRFSSARATCLEQGKAQEGSDRRLAPRLPKVLKKAGWGDLKCQKIRPSWGLSFQPYQLIVAHLDREMLTR